MSDLKAFVDVLRTWRRGIDDPRLLARDFIVLDPFRNSESVDVPALEEAIPVLEGGTVTRRDGWRVLALFALVLLPDFPGDHAFRVLTQPSEDFWRQLRQSRLVDDFAFALEEAVESEPYQDPRLRLVLRAVHLESYRALLPDDDGGSRSFLLGDFESQKGWFGMADESPSEGPPLLPTAAEESSRPFSAFPHLNAPERFPRNERFDVTVGFRSDPDPRLSEVEARPWEVEKPKPGLRCQIVLIGDGVRLERSSVEVPLEVGAAVIVGAWIEPEAVRARVRAQYTYDHELLGTSTREIEIAGGTPFVLPPDPCRITTETSTPPDLTATAMYAADGTLKWTLFAKAISYQTAEPLSIKLGRASSREFAKDLMRDVGTSLGKSYWPTTISVLASEVTQAIPREFFAAIHALKKQLRRTPSVLLVTEETYVPWELAWMDPPLNEESPQHLGCQVNFGRWVDETNVVLPPACDVAIRGFYAVAHGGLPHSLEERAALEKAYAAMSLPATLEGMEPILVQSDDRRKGIHLAVHGESNPEANEQALLLEDGEDLPARALGRPHRCGEEAVCGFMFLSACQVGVVGTTLGLTGGFPGVMMRSGSDGIVGPFWDVNDGVAKRLALEFYSNVLREKEKMTVGEAMRHLRLSAGRNDDEPDPRGETRLAYVYYGHPNMKMRRT